MELILDYEIFEDLNDHEINMFLQRLKMEMPEEEIPIVTLLNQSLLNQRMSFNTM
jgi:hypothetical protein